MGHRLSLEKDSIFPISDQYTVHNNKDVIVDQKTFKAREKKSQTTSVRSGSFSDASIVWDYICRQFSGCFCRSGRTVRCSRCRSGAD